MNAGNLNGLIACRHHPIVYQNVPKAGCTSIKCQLYKLDTGTYPENPVMIHRRIRRGAALVNFRNLDLLNRRLSERKIIFTFVRHPLNRAYSCFMEKIFFVHEFSFPNIRRYIEANFEASFPDAEVLATRTSVDGYDADQHRQNFKGFLSFVKQNMAGKTSVRKDPHWGLQSRMLNNLKHGYAVDYIGKIENFKEEFERVLLTAGVRDELDFNHRFNETPPFEIALDNIIDDEIRENSFEIYGDDYRQYDYK